GFALETDDGRASAEEKLRKKNLDFIVLNSTRDKGAGFAGDSNKITIIGRDNAVETFGLKPKTEVADDICTRIVALVNS
ncbi:MAG TPA: phosphopantothenoylcysteine decarboxylase, partial [Parapedobacter sp.]|nr:phosphopantothenoylcysteine decarboxylase [Parapedobacter sp.]